MPVEQHHFKRAYKLTVAERAELRKEKKQWNEFIRRMKKKGALIEEQQS